MLKLLYEHLKVLYITCLDFIDAMWWPQIGNNDNEDILNHRPGRLKNQGINTLLPIDAHEQKNIGGPHVEKVSEASTIGIAPTNIERTKAYYWI